MWLDIGICGAGVEWWLDGCIGEMNWLGVWPVSVCDWLSTPPLLVCQPSEAAGGIWEPVELFSGARGSRDGPG